MQQSLGHQGPLISISNVIVDVVMSALYTNLQDKLGAWAAVGASASVLSWIEHGVPLIRKEQSDIDTLDNYRCDNRLNCPSQQVFVESEINRLLEAGAIEKCADAPACVSPLTCVPKKKQPDGSGPKWRLVTDLRHVNNLLVDSHFKHEDIRTVIQFCDFGDLMIKVDIKDGYHHLSVRECDRDLLGFRFKDTYYRWRVLPFGLSLSAYYFCKLMRCVVTFLREQDIRCNCYVDDIVLVSDNKYITDHSDMLKDTLSDLGFTINVKKSCFTPTTELEYIGYIISTDNEHGTPGIRIPSRRLQSFRHDLVRILKRGCCTARALARVAGRAVAMSLAIVPGKLLLRGVYNLLRTRSSWESKLQLHSAAVEDLQWWLHAATSWNGRYAFGKSPEIQIYTDASHLGWGAVCQEQVAAGQWNKRVSCQSSNYREIMAVLMALVTFKSIVAGRTVEIMTDNITTMAYINGQGGPSLTLTHVAKAIWDEALTSNITIVARHVAGVLNIQADGLSRIHRPYEWMLHPTLFQWIDHVWGPHTVDRFADYITTQLPVYNSRFADPGSSGINALAQQDWASNNNYVCAPFCMLPAVLEVITAQRAAATIIAPRWTGQPWYQKMLKLLVAKPLPIPNVSRAFLPRGARPEPRRNRAWKVYAWRVNGALA